MVTVHEKRQSATIPHKPLGRRGRLAWFASPFIVAVLAGLYTVLSPHIWFYLEEANAVSVPVEVEQACIQLLQFSKSSSSSSYGEVYMRGSHEYRQSRHRYFSQAGLQPGCVFRPHSPEAISDAVKLIGQLRIPFAVSSGRHSYNYGHSSTDGGLQIDMKGFANLQLAPDKSWVDLGPGLTWEEVYEKLYGSGVTVVGGRANSVGVGGFISGGGGFSWLTSEYGLTANDVLEADLVTPQGKIVTVSHESDPDLFWAIRGGGNRFGVVFRWRLLTHERSEQIYNGMRVYPQWRARKINKALHNFVVNNTDPGAQVIVSYATVYGLLGIVCVQVSYNKPDPGNVFAMFDPEHIGKPWQDLFGVRPSHRLASEGKSDDWTGHRGYQGELTVEHLDSIDIINAVSDRTFIDGKFSLKDFWPIPRSFRITSHSIQIFRKGWAEPFKDKQGAWPYDKSPVLINTFHMWGWKRDDEHFSKVGRKSIEIVRGIAIGQGQEVDSILAYPNYVRADVSPEQIFGKENLARLQHLRKRYDPDNVMGLTQYLF